MPISINVIGAGRVGKTLARLIVCNHAGKIQGVVNQSYSSAARAVEFIGQGQAYATIEELPPADITFITTPDAQIQTCCEKIKSLKSGSLIVHCSGALTSSILNSTKMSDCTIASCHPLRSIANPDTSVADFAGCYCALEGDKDAVMQLTALLKKIGAHPFTLNANKKAIYHTAGVTATNYLVTLFNESYQHLKQAELSDELAKNLTLDMLSTTLNNLTNAPNAQAALTGPIKRGDLLTIQNNLAAIHSESQQALYAQLGLSTLQLTDLPQDQHQAIKHCLLHYLDLRTEL